LCAFLDGERYLVTGPLDWNALGLGATVMFAVTLVYNSPRNGKFQLYGCCFLLRGVYFPEKATAEWFIVGLLKYQDMASVGLNVLREKLITDLTDRSLRMRAAF
jgi:hypothetical protein